LEQPDIGAAKLGRSRCDLGRSGLTRINSRPRLREVDTFPPTLEITAWDVENAIGYLVAAVSAGLLVAAPVNRMS
jgi:hypothetical protein